MALLGTVLIDKFWFFCHYYAVLLPAALLLFKTYPQKLSAILM